MLFSKNEHPNSLKALENKEKRQVLYLPFALVMLNSRFTSYFINYLYFVAIHL